MTQIKKTAEVYELTRRYYSHQTRSEKIAKIKLAVRQDAAGRKKIDITDEHDRDYFVFKGSDPCLVATIAGMLHDAAQSVVDVPWEAGGKE